MYVCLSRIKGLLEEEEQWKDSRRGLRVRVNVSIKTTTTGILDLFIAR